MGEHENMAVYSGYIRKVFTNYLTNKHLRLQWVWVLVLWIGTFWFKSSTLWQALSLHLNIVIDWLLQRPLLSHIWACQGTGTTKRVNVVKNDILYSIGKSEPCQFTNNKVRRCVGAHPDKTYWSNDFNFTQFQLLKVCFISTVFLTANMEVKKTLSFELLKERYSASLLYWHSTPDQTKHVAILFLHLSSWKSVLLHYKWLKEHSSKRPQHWSHVDTLQWVPINKSFQTTFDKSNI